MEEMGITKGGRTGWKSPSNIALVKYWGKRPGQIPENPSLSMTLSSACTETIVEYEISDRDGLALEFLFEGKPRPDFEAKIFTFLNSGLVDLPFLRNIRLKISSFNTFPHSTGIASSASAMSALALCLVSIREKMNGYPMETENFFSQASFLARLGSGSACRSVYGGYTVWGFHPSIPGSSDERAIPVAVSIHPVFREMGDAILVVSSREKSVSSRAGHGLMEGHPYAAARYGRAASNALAMTRALENGDTESFVRITEQEALDLHALMMSSEMSYLLLEPATLSVIAAVRRFRTATGIPLCFTLDAGPNVHLIYPISHRERVLDWIGAELTAFCENGRFIDDRMGSGPEKLIV